MIGQYFDAGTYSILGSKLDEIKNSNNPENLKKVTTELEAMFIYELLKVMRKTVEISNKNDDPISNYNTLMDLELSKVLAERGIGLKEYILKALGSKETFSKFEKSVEKMTSNQKDYNIKLPVFGNVTSGFGIRKHPILGDYHFHKGIDIAAKEGTNIYPIKSGKVIYSGFDKGYGYNVVIEHENGLKTRYAHNSVNLVKEGDLVNEDTVIGKVGKTGFTTGYHLHFEVIKDEAPIDPGIVIANKFLKF